MQPTPDAVVAIVAKETGIDPERLVPDATLADLDIASIDMISVIFAVQDAYHVEISNEEAGDCATLGQFIDLTIAKAEAA